MTRLGAHLEGRQRRELRVRMLALFLGEHPASIQALAVDHYLDQLEQRIPGLAEAVRSAEESRAVRGVAIVRHLRPAPPPT